MSSSHPPKVSEKTLELNVGAEILEVVRGPLGRPHAYLRGLTQKEERAEGVDHFVNAGATEFLAFQFKAPKRSSEQEPYRFTLSREQHQPLSVLAAAHPGAVFYVLPFYLSPSKLLIHSPTLLQDTWFLRVADVPLAAFGGKKTVTIRCRANVASVNPDYPLQRIRTLLEPGFVAAPTKALALLSERNVDTGRVRSPWNRRGLRLLFLGGGGSGGPRPEGDVPSGAAGGATDE